MVLQERTDVGGVATERLEAEICELAGQIAAASARLVVMIAEYDNRRGWAEWGCQSAAHWLSWRCGIGMHAAREKLRVGHALSGLPLITAAFARGELSYSQVRAVTRIAGDHNDAALVEIARSSTANQLERLVAATARAERVWDDGFAGGVSDRLCKRRRCCCYSDFNCLMCVNSVWVLVRGSRSRTGVARGSNP